MELEEIRADLASARFSIKVNSHKWQNLEANATAKVRGYTTFLDKAKSAYTEADSCQTWPANVNDVWFEQEQLESAIEQANHARKRQHKRSRVYREMVSKVEPLARKLTEQMEAVAELDQEFALAQEIATASNSLVDVNDGLANRGQEIEATAAALQQEIEGLFDADWSNLLWYGPTPEFSEMFPDAQGSTTGK